MFKNQKDHFLIIGAGSWGTALASVLARNGKNVLLWGKEQTLNAIQKNHENSTYLPGIKLPDNINTVYDLTDGIATAEQIILAVPSHAFEEVLQASALMLQKKPGLTWVTKGLNPDTRFLHEVAQDYLGKDFPLALLTGPSFAKEVAEGLPTAVVIASNNKEYATCIQSAFKGNYFRVYYSEDILGAELGGAVKNVLALSVGIAQGLGFETNTRAALITRGLNEMMRLGEVLGAKRETLMGLSGLGDLILTCSDLKSRNLRLGILLGQGLSLGEACTQIGQVIEGIQTTKLIHELAMRHQVRMPLSEATYQILFEHMPIQEALQNLLNSDQFTEN
jgi:glycerol-3-phosphate dehydrogenase (NAD(P)+)